jgi:hypothetical protein
MEAIDRNKAVGDGAVDGQSAVTVDSPLAGSGSDAGPAVEIDEISFESALGMLGGSYAGNVPACG